MMPTTPPLTHSSGPVEFRCTDCGWNVVAFSYVEAPPPLRCATCNWIATLPPEDREPVRALLSEARRDP